MGDIAKAYATIEEGQLHLRQRIGGDGLPLIMLHASPASSASMVPLMEAMDGSRAIYAFDNSCNGQSCPPLTTAPEMRDFADMLDRACDALGLETIALHGTHTGAHIAIAWALARPDRIKALSLDGVAMLSEEPRTDMLANYAPLRKPDEYGSQFAWAWQYLRDQMIFFPHYHKRAENIREGGNFDPKLLHDLTLDILNNLENYHLPYHAVFRHDARADLAKLSLPTLLMSDAGGVLDPAFAKLCKCVPNASVAKDCSDPASKAAAIEAFLAENTE